MSLDFRLMLNMCTGGSTQSIYMTASDFAKTTCWKSRFSTRTNLTTLPTRKIITPRGWQTTSQVLFMLFGGRLTLQGLSQQRWRAAIIHFNHHPALKIILKKSYKYYKFCLLLIITNINKCKHILKHPCFWMKGEKKGCKLQHTFHFITH